MKSRNYEDFIMRDIARDIAHHERLQSKQQSEKPPAPEPRMRFLDQVPDQPLTWLPTRLTPASSSCSPPSTPSAPNRPP
jgi:hypothetical protein